MLKLVDDNFKPTEVTKPTKTSYVADPAKLFDILRLQHETLKVENKVLQTQLIEAETQVDKTRRENLELKQMLAELKIMLIILILGGGLYLMLLSR